MSLLDSYQKQRYLRRFFFAWRITFSRSIRWRFCCKDYGEVKQKALSFKIRSITQMSRTLMHPSSLNTAFPSCKILRILSSNGERQFSRIYLQKQQGYEDPFIHNLYFLITLTSQSFTYPSLIGILRNLCVHLHPCLLHVSSTRARHQ